MKIGKYTIHIIDSGRFALDGGAMFGVIPKPLWERTNKPDTSNRITLATRNLLLSSGTRNILIDTGMGEKWDEKSRDIYCIDSQNFSMKNALAKVGFTPSDITDVFLTHLHFDHTGGSTIFEGNKIVPAFPNAKYYVSQRNLEWALEPTERDKGSYLKENFVPLLECGVLVTLPPNQQFFDDEIEIIHFNGHTFSQQLVRIFDSSASLFYSADLFPTSAHIPLPYIMGYDLQPLITLQEKKWLLPKAIEENWFLFFEHDPQTAYATVVKTDKGFRAGNLYESF